MTASTALIFLGRIMFGLYFLYNGINHFKNIKGMTAYAKSKGIPMPKQAVMVTGALLILGGIGFFLNVALGASTILLLLFLVPTTILMHQFWKITDPMHRSGEKINFLKNLALIGALLMMIKF